MRKHGLELLKLFFQESRFFVLSNMTRIVSSSVVNDWNKCLLSRGRRNFKEILSDSSSHGCFCHFKLSIQRVAPIPCGNIDKKLLCIIYFMKERYINSLEKLLLQNLNLESIAWFKGLIFHITKQEINIIDILSNPLNHGRSSNKFVFWPYNSNNLHIIRNISLYKKTLPKN